MTATTSFTPATLLVSDLYRPQTPSFIQQSVMRHRSQRASVDGTDGRQFLGSIAVQPQHKQPKNRYTIRDMQEHELPFKPSPKSHSRKPSTAATNAQHLVKQGLVRDMADITIHNICTTYSTDYITHDVKNIDWSQMPVLERPLSITEELPTVDHLSSVGSRWKQEGEEEVEVQGRRRREDKENCYTPLTISSSQSRAVSERSVTMKSEHRPATDSVPPSAVTSPTKRADSANAYRIQRKPQIERQSASPSTLPDSQPRPTSQLRSRPLTASGISPTPSLAPVTQPQPTLHNRQVQMESTYRPYSAKTSYESLRSQRPTTSSYVQPTQPAVHEKMLYFWMTQQQADAIMQRHATEHEKLVVREVEAVACSSVVVFHIPADAHAAVIATLHTLLHYTDDQPSPLPQLLANLPAAAITQLYSVQAKEIVYQLQQLQCSAEVVNMPVTATDSPATEQSADSELLSTLPLGILNGKLMIPATTHSQQMYSVHRVLSNHATPRMSYARPPSTATAQRRPALNSTHPRILTQHQVLRSRPRKSMSQTMSIPHASMQQHMYWVKRDLALKAKVTAERQMVHRIHELESQLRYLQTTALPMIQNSDKPVQSATDRPLTAIAGAKPATRFRADQRPLKERIHQDIQALQQCSTKPQQKASNGVKVPRVALLATTAPKTPAKSSIPLPPQHKKLARSLDLTPRQQMLAQPKQIDYTQHTHDNTPLSTLLKRLPPLPMDSPLLIPPQALHGERSGHEAIHLPCQIAQEERSRTSSQAEQGGGRKPASSCGWK